MGPRYRTVAVIGTGPSGFSAVRALDQEKIFDTIRVFERRDRVGGTWNYDPTPDVFPSLGDSNTSQKAKSIPTRFPQFTPPAAEDTTARTGIYEGLDSNVGAKVMAFTHTPLPEINSPLSIERLGNSNPTRPFPVVAQWLEDLFHDYLHLISFNTTVEKVEKVGDKWTVTLRRKGQLRHGQVQDYWWQEKFDAIVVASGHYNVPFIPDVPGLEEASKAHPNHFEHSKSYRSQNDYIGKKVVVVGGNVSAADVVSEIYPLVKGPLYLSQRGKNEALQAAWELPNVEAKPQIKNIETIPTGINVEFTDGSKVDNVDKVIFGTGFRASYPFLTPDPVTPNNRLAGFYQHIFKVGDPSLAIVGQVRAGISFRVYEYQAVAVARYFAGRGKSLPSLQEQDLWEVKRVQYKGPSTNFHEVKPDFKEYFDFLVGLAGPPAPESEAYELPPWDDKWAELAFAVLPLKEKYWKSVRERSSKPRQERAKL
ncbi:hypothetical protein Plec18167_004350 [Paecilomyces lecythidis]|uniref:Dimethylaniline monooxygenase n=1 Tax=Paecilomyces lecythidis TaxID=3004212 RepID=A0ABR3XST1_9EURO